MELLNKGTILGFSVFFLSIFMDLYICPNEYRILKNFCYKLLVKGYILAFINLCVITPLLYNYVTPFVVNNKDDTFYLGQFFLMILYQNIGYYIAHIHMHNGLYWIHKFHHQYNYIVIPSSAFAVTIYEYLYAYIFPLIMGAFFINPTDISFLSSVGLIALFNLFIHSPTLQMKNYSKIFVSPTDHLKHHEYQNENYAAPIFALDRLKIN